MLIKGDDSDDHFTFQGKHSRTGIDEIRFNFRAKEKTITMEIWYINGAQAANQMYRFGSFNLPWKGVSVSGPTSSAPSWSHRPIEHPTICFKLSWNHNENIGNYVENFNKIWDEVVKQEDVENPDVLELKEKIQAFEKQFIEVGLKNNNTFQ